MQNQLFMTAALVLFSVTITLADEKPPGRSEEARPAEAIPEEKNWELQEGPKGPVLKEVESIRNQLGPEYSIESKELGIERDRDLSSPHTNERPNEPWSGTKLHQEVREFVTKFRNDARHLEEMAAHAEQLSEFALADQLRAMAHRQWEAARELSQPRSTRDYRELWRPTPAPPSAAPVSTPNPYGPPHDVKPSMPERPAESAPQYGVPSAPNQRFSVPRQPEPRKR
ncbi:hypothetical protein C5Y96_17820 [Blastopirellula marina]|uniref:Uncharacterized protein n=2 Tax=Pirellulales TaxID=2691354 RepID=A0A2S8F5H0_9BACT|nr:hypothetical protein C5Y96_17820 [Blastopirellula marina]RCS47934.1 hypothetical protein DTL36_17845 [Bremerella cremea]